VTSICCVFNVIGSMFGIVFNSFVIVDPDTMNDNQYKDAVSTYFLFEAIICIVCCTPGLILIRSKPKVPPRYYYLVNTI